MSLKGAKKLLTDILVQLYMEADPPCDLNNVKSYMDHYMPQERQKAIIQAHMKKSKLPKLWKDRVMSQVHADSPITCNTKTA